MTILRAARSATSVRLKAGEAVRVVEGPPKDVAEQRELLPPHHLHDCAAFGSLPDLCVRDTTVVRRFELQDPAK